MGKYINYTKDGEPLPIHEKARFLIEHAAAKPINPPTEFQPNLVCVVENGLFDAALYAENEREMTIALSPDHRPRTWLIVPDADKLVR